MKICCIWSFETANNTYGKIKTTIRVIFNINVGYKNHNNRARAPLICCNNNRYGGCALKINPSCRSLWTISCVFEINHFNRKHAFFEKMGALASVMQWYCDACGLINPTEQNKCGRCGAKRNAASANKGSKEIPYCTSNFNGYAVVSRRKKNDKSGFIR